MAPRRWIDSGRIHERWFLRKLPSGVRLDRPMNAQFQTLIDTMVPSAGSSSPAIRRYTRPGPPACLAGLQG